MKLVPSVLLAGIASTGALVAQVSSKIANEKWQGRLLISYGRHSAQFVEMDASGETLWTNRLEPTLECDGGINHLFKANGAPRREDRPPCHAAARLLPNGHRLICQVEAFDREAESFFLIHLFEHDRAGEPIRKQRVTVPDPGTRHNDLRAVQRLQNGNTLIATESLVLEVSGDGRIINRLTCTDGGFPTTFSWAQQRYSGEIQLYCVGPGFSYLPMYAEIESWRPLREDDARNVPEFGQDAHWSPFSAEHSRYSPLGDKTFVFSGDSILCLRKNEIAWTRKFDKGNFRPRHWPAPSCEGFEFLEDGSFFLAQSYLFPVYDGKGQLTDFDRRSRVTLFDKRGAVIWETSFRYLVNSISYLKRPTRSK